jgi:hypothetical protein
MKIQSQKPKDFDLDIFEMTRTFSKDDCQKAWDKLQLRETFVRGQFPPYKVEFEATSQSGAFESGELNIHHGPFLSVHGAIGEVSPTYRDLLYFYGSYILSFRLIRPVRLEFFKTENSIKVQLTSYVHPLIKPIWKFGLKFFWGTFGITF